MPVSIAATVAKCLRIEFMRKMIWMLAVLSTALTGCEPKDTAPHKIIFTTQKWDYKSIEIDCYQHEMAKEAFPTNNAVTDIKLYQYAQSSPGDFRYTDRAIADLGAQGWELVSAVPELETIPDADYVGAGDLNPNTGKLEPNTFKAVNIRTGKILLIFKKPAD